MDGDGVTDSARPSEVRRQEKMRKDLRTYISMSLRSDVCVVSGFSS